MISEFSFNHQHTKETELKCSIPILLEKSQLKSGSLFQILCISAPQSTDQSINTFPRKDTSQQNNHKFKQPPAHDKVEFNKNFL